MVMALLVAWVWLGLVIILLFYFIWYTSRSVQVVMFNAVYVYSHGSINTIIIDYNPPLPNLSLSANSTVKRTASAQSTSTL